MLNDRMCAQSWLDLLAASLPNEQPRSRKLWRSYPEVVNHLLQKYATDKAIAEYDAAILRYVQSTNMTTQPYSVYLIAKRARSSTYMKKARSTMFLLKVMTFPSTIDCAFTAQQTLERIKPT